MQVEVTRLLVASYFDIVRKNLQVRDCRGVGNRGRHASLGCCWTEQL